jgi:energy-coupling factor transport system ATP-binding protein
MVEHRVEAALPLVQRAVVLEAGGGVVADGRPREVFATRGDALAEAGVWVPDVPFPLPPRRERPPAATLLLAEQVGFSYPGGSRPALGGVDAAVRSSEALAILGPNGSGKSTLALLLAGLLRPSAGAVVAGEALRRGHGHEPIWRWPARQLVAAIGTVFGDPEHQFRTGSVRDELLLGPMRAGVAERVAARHADELLERLHLAALADANPFTLSGGEKRRLSVATALAAAPAVLILDEPTFGQDRRTRIELLLLLAALRDSGKALAFVTHDLDFANALADHALVLAAGHATPETDAAPHPARS